MKQALANLVSSGGTALVAGGVAAVGLGAWGVYRYLKNRPTPAELERRRRHHLHSSGKMGDANLLEFKEQLPTVFNTANCGFILLYPAYKNIIIGAKTFKFVDFH